MSNTLKTNAGADSPSAPAISISLDLITETLSSIYWNISPYQDHPDLDDHPHILELANTYNKILKEISDTCSHDFPPFPI